MAILAAPTFDDLVITPVGVSVPQLWVSRTGWPPIIQVPGEVSIIGEVGVYLPLVSAAAMVNAFIVEPGSTTSVTARLRRSLGVLLRTAFGLNDGRFAIPSTSPVWTSITTIEPESALFFSSASFNAL